MMDWPHTEVTLGPRMTAGAGEWDRRLPFNELLPRLMESPIGAKDGACYTPATFRGNRRNAFDSDEIGIVVLDSDCGHTFEEITAVIDAAGYASLIHSTHSHLTTQTLVKCKALEKSGGDIVAHMLKKGYLPRVVENARISGEAKNEDGADCYVVEHEPCPKFRILIPLAYPWRADAYMDQSSANNAWRNFIHALAAFGAAS
jgi:hypothetical protein